uniref:Uncharacterized protein n=1 Tax=Arundo donax TaxID=35708 RepID=A0A0A9DDW2_ARUDO
MSGALPTSVSPHREARTQSPFFLVLEQGRGICAAEVREHTAYPCLWPLMLSAIICKHTTCLIECLNVRAWWP